MKYGIGFLSIVSMFFLIACRTALAAPAINILTPNGGETYVEGDTVRITWVSQNVDHVTISYSTCISCITTIVSNIPNTNSYTWRADIGDAKNRSILLAITGYQDGKQVTDDYTDSTIVVLKSSLTSSPSKTSTSKRTAGIAITQQAEEVTATTAQLVGTASAGGTEGIYAYFEIFQGNQLFSTTEKTLVSTSQTVFVQKKHITALSPNTVYTYRLVTEKDTTKTEGELKTFKTEQQKNIPTPIKEVQITKKQSTIEEGEQGPVPAKPQESAETLDKFFISPEQVSSESDLQQFKDRILLKYPSISTILSTIDESGKTKVTVHAKLQGSIFGIIPHTFETQMTIQSTTDGVQITFTQPWWCLITFGTILHKDEIRTHLLSNDAFPPLLEVSSTPQITAKIIDLVVTELDAYF